MENDKAMVATVLGVQITHEHCAAIAEAGVYYVENYREEAKKLLIEAGLTQDEVNKSDDDLTDEERERFGRLYKKVLLENEPLAKAIVVGQQLIDCEKAIHALAELTAQAVMMADQLIDEEMAKPTASLDGFAKA